MATFKRLLAYLKYTKLEFSLGLLALILSTGLSVYAPLVAKQFIDDTSQRITNHQQVSMERIMSFFGIYLVIVLMGVVFSYLGNYLTAKISYRLSKKIRDQAHEHMQELPISYFDDKPAGKISARIVNDTEVLQNNFYQSFINQVLVNLMLVVGIYAALIYVNPTIGLAFTLLVPLFIVWQVLYMKTINPLNVKWRELVSDINNQIAELIQGITIVQAFNQEGRVIDEFEATSNEWYATRMKIQKIDGTLTWTLSDALKNLGVLAVMAYLGSQFLDGVLGLSVGTLYVIISYVSSLFDPITQIVRMMTRLQQSLVAGSRVFELLDQPVEVDTTRQFQIGPGEVEFKDVSFAYQPGEKVLKNLNFHVKPGQTVGLVGHTGSGKSSIINLIFRFYDPQEGTILIDGQDIQEYSRESVRSDMGIVLQEPYLFSGTIASNISMNDETIDRDRIRTAIQQVGAQDLIDKLDKGIDEPVVEKGQSLSSGERQLISFARTLAADPKILILDEATSHIDTETEQTIQKAMAVLQEGRTTFVIAHRLSTIQQADQILVLDRGTIQEVGTHQELMALDGLYAEMYRMQAKMAWLIRIADFPVGFFCCQDP